MFDKQKPAQIFSLIEVISSGVIFEYEKSSVRVLNISKKNNIDKCSIEIEDNSFWYGSVLVGPAAYQENIPSNHQEKTQLHKAATA